MNILSLTYAELERLLKVFLLLTIAIAIVVFLIRWKCFGATIFSAAWQSVSLAVSVATIVFGVFSRITWTSIRLADWLGRPIIHGIWWGSLRSNFLDSDGHSLPPVDMYFIVRQTYLTLSIESFTRSQEGESTIEAISRNAKTDATKVAYVFELRRLYSGENKLTVGSGELRLLESGTRLRGHYFTNSPTQGDLDLRLLSRDCRGIDSFDSAEARRLVSSDAK